MWIKKDGVKSWIAETWVNFPSEIDIEELKEQEDEMANKHKPKPKKADDNKPKKTATERKSKRTSKKK